MSLGLIPGKEYFIFNYSHKRIWDLANANQSENDAIISWPLNPRMSNNQKVRAALLVSRAADVDSPQWKITRDPASKHGIAFGVVGSPNPNDFVKVTSKSDVSAYRIDDADHGSRRL